MDGQESKNVKYKCVLMCGLPDIPFISCDFLGGLLKSCAQGQLKTNQPRESSIAEGSAAISALKLDAQLCVLVSW